MKYKPTGLKTTPRQLIIYLIILSAIVVGVGLYFTFNKNQATNSSANTDKSITINSETKIIDTPDLEADPNKPEESLPSYTRVDLSKNNNTYRFAVEIPIGWQIEYIPETEAINIFDPNATESTSLEQSQFFIRNFEANDFLTLSTVDILVNQPTTIAGHEAVHYEIKKKTGVANFTNQPSWRNEQHNLTDIRFTNTNPSLFYVMAYAPDVPTDVVDHFFDSLQFHNDPISFTPPLERSLERITKKPFGILIDPATSPVQPERFSGYHTAADIEIFEDEITSDIMVRSFCGGAIRQVKTVNGYGGVVIQDCIINDSTITVLYGHLKIDSVELNVGNYIASNEPIGLLGDHLSTETDGERKHLHFSLHHGSDIELRGYVNSQSMLTNWIDPEQYL